MPITPQDFELWVAQAYRDLGANVEHNKSIDGLQIDVFVIQSTPDGSSIRTAVECKRLADPLDLPQAVEICRRFSSLKSAGSIDKGVIVSQAGFTKDARTHCAAHRIECFTPADLGRKLADFEGYLRSLIEGPDLPLPYVEILQKNAFVSLRAHMEDGTHIPSIVEFIDQWLAMPSNFMALLGEYGSGKTTTSWHLAQRLAAAHLRTATGRIPILIELKRFSKHFSLRSFLADLFLAGHGINIKSYALFEKLNSEGRFLLIFDGFDEMTTYSDPAIVVRYADEILSLTHSRAKVLLTCRTSFFKDQTDLEMLKAGTDLQALLEESTNHTTAFLDEFSTDQVRHYLASYYGEQWLDIADPLEQQPAMRSLAVRPILLNMIVNTIHSAQSLNTLSVAQLYERYTDIWLARDNWRCNLSPDQRKYISQFLAFHMITNGLERIHHKDLYSRLAENYRGTISIQMLEQYAHEVRTCSFLRNDMQGFFSFAHRTIAEFLAARYVLERLTKDDPEVLASSLSIEALAFMRDLVRAHPSEVMKYLWDLMRPDSTPKASARAKAVGAYLLLTASEDLSSADLSGLSLPDESVLTGATARGTNCVGLNGSRLMLDGTDFSSSNMSRSILRDCSFRRAILRFVDFTGADLSGSDFSGADLRDADFRGAKLERVSFSQSDLNASASVQENRRARFTEELLNSVAELRALAGTIPVIFKKQGVRKYIDRLNQYRPPNSLANVLPEISRLRSLVSSLREAVEPLAQKSINTVALKVRRQGAQSQASQRGRQEEELKRLKKSCELMQEKFQYILRKLDSLSNDAQGFLSIRTPGSAGSHHPVTQVKGARFANSSGLAKAQSEWLEWNGAKLREPEPNT
jgi:uncharacterized protein YjbI with pentapeptide repeats